MIYLNDTQKRVYENHRKKQLKNLSIIKILMKRDGNTKQEAINRIIDVQIYITEELNEDDHTYAYDILRDELDFESDHLMEVMDY